MVHTIRLPKQSTVGDVINDLKTKVNLDLFIFTNACNFLFFFFFFVDDNLIVGGGEFEPWAPQLETLRSAT